MNKSKRHRRRRQRARRHPWPPFQTSPVPCATPIQTCQHSPLWHRRLGWEMSSSCSECFLTPPPLHLLSATARHRPPPPPSPPCFIPGAVSVMRNLADLISLEPPLPRLWAGSHVFALFTSDSVIILVRAPFLIAVLCRVRLSCQSFSSLIDTRLKICINSGV